MGHFLYPIYLRMARSFTESLILELIVTVRLKKLRHSDITVTKIEM